MMQRSAKAHKLHAAKERSDDPPLRWLNTEMTHPDPWRRGIEQFNAREFFECHESLEEIWLPAPEPDKTFLQGIIQVACAFHHHLRGNPRGAKSLMRRGLAKLDGFPAGYRGVRLAALRAEARRWLDAWLAGGTLPVSELPVIEWDQK